MTAAVAKRYARALFALAGEENRVEEQGRELAALIAAFAHRDLAAVAASPAVSPGIKRELVGKIVARLGASTLLARFAAVVAEHDRLGSLAAIGEQYRKLVDRQLGQVRARIRSARPLSSEGEAEIRQAFERKTGKKVLAEVTVDPDLIGGVAVEIEGRVYDGTVRTQLEAIKTALSG